jgi:cell division protein FtsI/penicillin-binding protein 2
MMLALAAGLWRLQVLGAENFRLQAEQNRIRKEPVLAARGKLFDREEAGWWWTTTRRSPASWFASRTAT